MRVKSITGRIHDTGYGGYPYKITVMIEVPVAEFNTLCPIVGKASHGICGYRAPRRDLGNLVVQVNNALCAFNRDIPAWNPSIDSNGSKRSKNGIKTLEFVYFFQDHTVAQKLGFEVMKLKNGDHYPKYNQRVRILSPQEQGAA